MLSFDESNNLIKLAQQGNEEAKTTLITENMPLIKSIVSRYKNKLVEYEDLIQLGTLGLVKAINNFKMDYGVRFSTYAVPMIAGEIKRFIRDDGAIKVSRSTKSQALEINKYIDEYRVNNERPPTIEQLSDKFGVDATEIVFILESTKYPVSIYAETEEEGLSLADKISDGLDFDDELNKSLLKELISSLPERDKNVIILRYFRDYTQTEVAELLGVSQVQVSRLEAKIIDKMRKSFKDN
ncbi:MAG: sigma-70 family RNA polymerase sigma factor [Clostridia bacterium]|nr:sigma-70 family RNA polymerase sigma factor [Clostridia bacterium]